MTSIYGNSLSAPIAPGSVLPAAKVPGKRRPCAAGEALPRHSVCIAYSQVGRLGRADRPEIDHVASIIYYKVDDIEKVAEIFKARGVEFIIDPHLVAPMPTYDLWLADFRDSEGNILALMSEVPKEVA